MRTVAVMLGNPAFNSAALSPPWLMLLKGGDSVQILSAGLPGISGSISAATWLSPARGTITDSGALTSTKSSHGWSGTTDTSGYKLTQIKFNAGSSNSIYGAANTVQPPALELIPQIKI